MFHKTGNEKPSVVAFNPMASMELVWDLFDSNGNGLLEISQQVVFRLWNTAVMHVSTVTWYWTSHLGWLLNSLTIANIKDGKTGPGI